MLLQKERQLSGLLGQGDVRGLSLIKMISQATFDEAVKENTDEFGMEFDEAVKEALEQFKSQGCDLSNISIKENTEQGMPPLGLLQFYRSCTSHYISRYCV